jgi:hypothetical protein
VCGAPIRIRLNGSSAAGGSGWSREIGGFEFGGNGAVIGDPAFGKPRECVGFLVDGALIVFAALGTAKLVRRNGVAITIVTRRFLHPFLFVRLDSKLVFGLFAFVDVMGPKAVPASGISFGRRTGTVMEDRVSSFCVDTRPQVIVDVVSIFALSEHEYVFPTEGSCGAGLAEDGVLLTLLLEVVELLVERLNQRGLHHVQQGPDNILGHFVDMLEALDCST